MEGLEEKNLNKIAKDLIEMDKTLKKKKDESFKQQNKLMKMREQEAGLYSNIQGTMAALRNLQSQINKLQHELTRQQELIYNAEYLIQLLERKVSKATGEKTRKEATILSQQIEQAEKTKETAKDEMDNLRTAKKNLDDERRNLERDIKASEELKAKYTTIIEKLNLENEMTLLELSKIIKEKENTMVQHDIMKLEILKIRERLRNAHDEVLQLENKKNQLELGLSEREKEIMVHKNVLMAEYKAAEQERHKIAVELAKRQNIVKNNRIKFESLRQRKQGGAEGDSYDKHSQAYYMIKAGQEKEELQRKEDELNAQIIKSYSDLNALKNTRNHLNNRNTTYRDYFLNRGWTEKDVEQKANLDEQLKVAGDNLIKKRTEFQKLKAEIDENAKTFNEQQARLDVLYNQRQQAESQLAKVSDDAEKQKEKAERAERFLKKAQEDLRRKSLVVSEAATGQLVAAQLEDAANFKKTLQAVIL